MRITDDDKLQPHHFHVRSTRLDVRSAIFLAFWREQVAGTRYSPFQVSPSGCRIRGRHFNTRQESVRFSPVVNHPGTNLTSRGNNPTGNFFREGKKNESFGG